MSIDEASLAGSLNELEVEEGHSKNGSAVLNGNDSAEEQETLEADDTPEESQCVNGGGAGTNSATKKKKKKSKAKKATPATEAELEAGRIKISRNKHMRFISSYHVCDAF